LTTPPGLIVCACATMAVAAHSRSTPALTIGLYSELDMISCRRVSKRFGKLLALDDVTFDLASGIGVLIGPNGAGKSTLLNILAGLLPPSEGEVRVAGCDPQTRPLSLRRAMGVLPDDLGLFDALTIEEHLDLCGPIYGLSRAETRARTDALLRALGLEAGRHTFLDQCSHGMRKKTALAMALLHNPRVLLLDEPFEGIDPVSSRMIADLLAAAAGRGITVLLTAHSLPVIDRLANSIMMMRGGRIVWSSAANELSRPLEELYFDLVVTPVHEDLPWLRSAPS
jgi:ABC-2 type transport system ATP-binding protein